jgi:lipoate-protein ligase A
MKYIKNTSVSPYYNLAFEEYILNNFKDDDYVLLWQNDNTIVVGKHQNTAEEINQGVVEEFGVNVVRRNTGGGAVYHDLGNINFSFISSWKLENGINYEIFLRPIIKALNSIGVNAIKKGRNDIVVEEKKISGNAQMLIKDRILHHGTLLFDSDLLMMERVLNVAPDKIASKGIKSIRARVANIKAFLDIDINVLQLMDILVKSFFKNSEITEVILTEKQLLEIKTLAKEKYESWDWNYGNSPQSNYMNSMKFEFGKVEINLFINEGLIESCKINGDFLSLRDITDLEKSMVGIKYDINEIRNKLEEFDLSLYFGQATIEEILHCFIE